MINKYLEIIGWIVIMMFLVMIILFVIMCLKLLQYDKCQNLEFEPSYCEKYKNF